MPSYTHRPRCSTNDPYTLGSTSPIRNAGSTVNDASRTGLSFERSVCRTFTDLSNTMALPSGRARHPPLTGILQVSNEPVRVDVASVTWLDFAPRNPNIVRDIECRREGAVQMSAVRIGRRELLRA